jgi:hypothetical protein
MLKGKASSLNFLIVSIGWILVGVFIQKFLPIGMILREIGLITERIEINDNGSMMNERAEVDIGELQTKKLIVALVFGQSNSANSGESRKRANDGVYNFYRRKLYRAEDPLLGADGNKGSVWTRLGDKLLEEKLYDAIVFIPIGVSNTSIMRWTSGGDLHLRITNAINDTKKKGLKISHLLWHQGEADVKVSKNEYKKAFLNMLWSIRIQGVEAPIYIAIATKCGKRWGNTEIQEAQKELINISEGIYPGPDTDSLGFCYRYDGCHFSDEGLEEHAELWLETLKGKH